MTPTNKAISDAARAMQLKSAKARWTKLSKEEISKRMKQVRAARKPKPKAPPSP